MSDKARIDEIKTRIEQSPRDWKAEYFGDECKLKAMPSAAMSVTSIHETYATLRTPDFDAIELLRHARDDLEFLLSLIERASAKIRSLEAQKSNPQDNQAQYDAGTGKDYTSNCAILCGEPSFKKYLKSVHGLGSATNEATAAKVRELLGIASRKTLNENQEKAKLWLQLTREFENWKKHG